MIAGALSESDRVALVAHLETRGECRRILALLTSEEGPPYPVALATPRRK